MPAPLSSVKSHIPNFQPYKNTVTVCWRTEGVQVWIFLAEFQGETGKCDGHLEFNRPLPWRPVF
jgi:hypothetical protein